MSSVKSTLTEEGDRWFEALDNLEDDVIPLWIRRGITLAMVSSCMLSVALEGDQTQHWQIFIASIDFAIGISIGILPVARTYIAGQLWPIVFAGDLKRVGYYIALGFRNWYSFNPVLCAVIWIFLLPWPVYVSIIGTCSTSGRCRPEFQIVVLLTAFLAVNVRSDVWVHTNCKTSADRILPSDQSLSLPLKVRQGMKAVPEYNAVGLFTIKRTTSVSGVYVCLDQLLFSGGGGPSFPKDSCCGRVMSYSFSDQESYGCSASREGPDWWIKPNFPQPGSLRFFTVFVDELSKGSGSSD